MHRCPYRYLKRHFVAKKMKDCKILESLELIRSLTRSKKSWVAHTLSGQSPPRLGSSARVAKELFIPQSFDNQDQ